MNEPFPEELKEQKREGICKVVRSIVCLYLYIAPNMLLHSSMLSGNKLWSYETCCDIEVASANAQHVSLQKRRKKRKVQQELCT